MAADAEGELADELDDSPADAAFSAMATPLLLLDLADDCFCEDELDPLPAPQVESAISQLPLKAGDEAVSVPSYSTSDPGSG